MTITRLLIGINVLIFVAMFYSGADTPEQLIEWGANFGPYTTGGQAWRLLTAVFIHVNTLHLFFNMWALWNLGLIVESTMGPVAFLVVYFISGLAGSVMSVTWHPNIVSAGASGAIFGLFGAMIGLIGRRALLTGLPAGQGVLKSLMINVGLNLGISLLPGIDLAAHAGGFLSGTALGLLIDPSGRRPLQHPLPIAVLFLLLLGLAFSYISTY